MSTKQGVMSSPRAELSMLPKADGSGTFSYGGFSVTAAVNGPIEAAKRDESAFEAQVDVIVRPAAGVGGTAERQLEGIVQSALRQLITVGSFPRCMFQVTLQVLEMPENLYANTKVVQAQLNLAIIPALIHAAMIGLLLAAVPLKSIATAVTLAFGTRDGKVEMIVDPGARETAMAESVHVLGFTSDGELLMAESLGSFSVEQWEQVLEAGRRICCRDRDSGLDTVMAGDGLEGLESPSVKAFIRATLETQTLQDLYWK
ncbi:hypothetical protein CDD82_7312 [Ophiocordyceps australis]|uniref:Uncharacterized protein n=1 Tax=Ophiocordyceps australis TaxID=1399860 RepID=A0A2C5ZJ40_9HYPO|nr:hypothetical protein CDD82_7312 [Ophiocordyceps australis]